MDMNINQEHLDHIKGHVCTGRCISWSAVIMGALVAIALSFLLNLFCLGIGISAFPSSNSGELVYAVGGFIGLVVCAILAMFPAGFVAGKLGRSYCLKRRAGELYGLAAWTLALIITVLIGPAVGNFIDREAYIVTRQPVNMQLSMMATQEASRLANTNVTVDPKKAQDATAMTIFATFFIFLIGMLAACFGGRCAMMCGIGELAAYDQCHQCNKKECMVKT